jgi:hypothetical protein
MMNVALALLFTLCLACRDRSPPTGTPGVASVASDGAVHESEEDRINRLQDARFEQLWRLKTCRPEDWPELVLMAVDRHDWGDDLAVRHKRAAQDVQCRALFVLLDNVSAVYPQTSNNIHQPDPVMYHRVVAALSRPQVISALEDAISGRVAFGPGCTPDDFARFAGNVMLQQLRSAIEAHASERAREDAFEVLDRARGENSNSRVTQLKRWAGELSTSGFERVLEAIAPGYVWNDGEPQPSKAEQKVINESASDLVGWLHYLAPRLPERDCGLSDAIAHGRLGELVIARLDHPSFEVKSELLDLLAMIPADGSRKRVFELETTDPNPHVRKIAAKARKWIDRGGRPVGVSHIEEPDDGSSSGSASGSGSSSR